MESVGCSGTFRLLHELSAFWPFFLLYFWVPKYVHAVCLQAKVALSEVQEMAFAYPTVFRSSPGAHSILLCLNLLHKVVCSRLLSGYMIDNLKSRNFLESEQNWAPLLDALRIPSFFRSQNWRENLQETSEKKIMVFAPSPWFLVISTVYLYLYPSISISLYIYMHI